MFSHYIAVITGTDRCGTSAGISIVDLWQVPCRVIIKAYPQRSPKGGTAPHPKANQTVQLGLGAGRSALRAVSYLTKLRNKRYGLAVA